MHTPTSAVLVVLLVTISAVDALSFQDWKSAKVRSTGVDKYGRRVNPYKKVRAVTAEDPTPVRPAKREATGGAPPTCNPSTDCCSEMVPPSDPAEPADTRRRSSSSSSSSPIRKRYPSYTGEILTPENAIRFIQSPWGAYEHTNGTWVYDRVYERETRAILERKAKRGVVGRFFAETLGGRLLTVVPRPIMIRKLIDIMQYRGGLFSASPNTAIRTEDIQPTLELLLAQPGFDGFSLHGYTYPKNVVEETLEVLRTMDASHPDAYDHADEREDQLEARLMGAARDYGPVA